VCRVRAIVRVDDDEAPFIDVHRCRGCKVCTLECPYDAIADT
jgi:MinD superfamily P-loop ATPase